jgi:hypothetical protein
MKPSKLHSHVRDSVRRVVSSRYKSGIRFVPESGSAEGFLRDLLAIELKERGYNPIREYRTKSGNLVDLALNEAPPEYIEAKQLHLKDGAQFVKNIVSDVKRHARCHCLGVVYVVDETGSQFEMQRHSFNGKNRNAEQGVGGVMKALQDSFHKVYPNIEKQARVRRFEWAGRLDLYAFVVENAR